MAWMLVAESTDLNFLEACLRMKIDGENDYQFLSSGTEDIFLSSYYFDAGVFHSDDSGATYLGKSSIAAYKFFESDPMLFTTGFQLVWRCGEDGQCPSSYGNSAANSDKSQETKVQLADTTVTIYTWIYEYTL